LLCQLPDLSVAAQREEAVIFHCTNDCKSQCRSETVSNCETKCLRFQFTPEKCTSSPQFRCGDVPQASPQNGHCDYKNLTCQMFPQEVANSESHKINASCRPRSDRSCPDANTCALITFRDGLAIENTLRKIEKGKAAIP